MTHIHLLSNAIMFRVCLTSSWFFLSCVVVAQSPSQKQSPLLEDELLRRNVLPLVTTHRGEVAVVIQHLNTGDTFRYHENVVMPAASLIKLPLMVTAYHAAKLGDLDLGKPVVLQETDKVPGSGILTDHFSAGATLPVRDYIRLMMRESDNTATNVIIDQIGLVATTKQMESLGLSETKLYSKVYRGSTTLFAERSKQFGIGSTTANEMVTLLQLLSEQKLADPSDTQTMFAHLASCTDRQMLARYLSPDTKFFHKTGAISNCRTDAGIMETSTGPVAVCVLTNRNRDQSWGDMNEAELLCAKIGRIIVDRYGAIEPDPTLRQGSTGLLVEALQRALNAKLEPTPDLHVDGEFGPGTEAALKRLQKQHNLPTSGELDKLTSTIIDLVTE